MAQFKLTKEQLSELKQLRENGEKTIYNLGINALQKYDLFLEWTTVNNLQNKFQDTLLQQYGEGELKVSEGIFVTKE
jgi:hypothetical protein